MSGVLFFSTENACRSQMAEALARRILSPEVSVFSAGTRPKALDPRAARMTREIGLDMAGQRAKSASDVPLAPIARVITFTDEAAEQAPPIPGAVREHWAIESPSDEVTLRAARDEILTRVRALALSLAPEPAIGVLGGSGFYDLPGLTESRAIEVETPFGRPSSPLMTGRLGAKRVVFLARHGEGHRLLPSEINARANLYALKRLGVRRLISISAVGSLREEIAPGHVVVPRQFLDRTAGRPRTFFGSGVVAHVSLADPVCGVVADALLEAASKLDVVRHASGTYLCIEGPQFSTRAESALWRSFGADVIGMTNLPEARLAREAEICYATLALPTDYDCWRTDEVSVPDVLAVLRANVERARQILADAIGALDSGASCSCQRALDTALLTAPGAIDQAARLRLFALLDRRLREA